MATKTPLDVAQEFAQETLSASPVVILGSGASAAHGIPGMWPLAEHLLKLEADENWDISENNEWSHFHNILRGGYDLETALGSVRLTARQTQSVVSSTRLLLLPHDLRSFSNLLNDNTCLPLTRLYKYLFTSTHRYIDVVTPNYDRLAEYAADAGHFTFHTGFTQGYLQVRAASIKRKPDGADRTVRIWKVHGSLDWFMNASGKIIGSSTVSDTPKDHSPLMVTPGLDKYRQTHQEPFRTIFACADTALEQARSYLCVGYGFNDEHVQTKMVERCEGYNVPIVIITKALSETAKAFLSSGRCRRYLAIEEGPSGSHAYTHSVPDGFELHVEPLWQFAKFLDFTIGDGK